MSQQLARGAGALWGAKQDSHAMLMQLVQRRTQSCSTAGAHLLALQV